MKLVDGARVPTVTDDAILGFFGDYRFLSNFEPTLVFVDGIVFNSSEAAYMAQKTTNREDQFKLSKMSGPAAKKFGQTVTLREDWEAYKVLAMTKCVMAKFLQSEELRTKLLATGDKYLEETNNWGDQFWGKTSKGGSNMLGHILMYVRSVIRENTDQA